MRKCEGCGKQFEPKRDAAKYCSRKCYLSSTQKMIVCKQCDKEVKKTHSYQKFCGRKCKGKYQSKKQTKGIIVKCLWCGKDTYKKQSRIRKHNFCSVRCRISYLKDPNTTMSKGWKHTKEAREKIKQANLKRNYEKTLTKKGRRALRESALKNLQNKESQQKSAQARIGIKLAEEHKRKIRVNARYGTDNSSWKGGITKLAARIRDLPEYKKWRTAVYERDSYTCRWCGKRSGLGKAIILHADHIVGFSDLLEKYKIKSIEQAILCEQLWNVANGRTLCIPCHEETDNYKGKRFDTA